MRTRLSLSWAVKKGFLEEGVPKLSPDKEVEVGQMGRVECVLSICKDQLGILEDLGPQSVVPRLAESASSWNLLEVHILRPPAGLETLGPTPDRSAPPPF